MKQHITQCNFYIIGWLLYYLQGLILGTSGSLFSRVLLLCLLGISIYNFVLVNVKYKTPIYIKGLNILIVMFMLYGIILLLSGKELYIMEGFAGKVQNFDYIKTILISLLPIYSFYHYTINDQLNSKNIKIWGILLFIGASLCYYQEQESYTQKLLMGLVTNEEFTNNAGYYIISAMPLIIIYKEKPILHFTLLLVAFILVLTSLKRGAILIGSIATIYIFFINMKNKENAKNSWAILSFIMFVLISIMCAYYLLENSEYANARMEKTLEGDDSFRREYYANLWEVFLHESSTTQMLLGRGAWGTLTVNDNYAHNDWLEILINQGLFGITMYAIYWLCLIKSINNEITTKKEKSMIILISVIIFAKTFFSMAYSDLSIIISLPIGFIFAGGKFNQERYNMIT